MKPDRRDILSRRMQEPLRFLPVAWPADLAFVSRRAVAQRVADGRPAPLLRDCSSTDDRFML